MNLIKILLLSFISVVCNAQIIINPYAHTLGGGQSGGLQYVAIPSRPALGTTSTVTYSSPGNITSGFDDKITSGVWDQVRLFSFDEGTELAPQRVSNEDNNFKVLYISGTANHAVANASDPPNWFEINGKSPTEPFLIDGNILSTSGIQISSTSAGNNGKFQNIIVKNAGAASLFMNITGTLSGGDASTPPTSSSNYQSFSAKFLRFFTTSTAGTEGFYIGNTSQSAAAIHQNFTVEHCLVVDTKWDGAQFNWHNNLDVSNLTVWNAGTDQTAAQNNALQVQNGKGIVENSIFNSHHLFTIASHDLIIRNNYFQWTDGFAGLIQDYYTQYGTCCRLMTTPVQILIENSDFDCENVTPCAALLDAPENDVTITVTNCRLENIDNEIFLQGTGGNLVDGGGNTFVSNGTIPVPTFNNLDDTDPDHGKLTEPTHHADGRGYRTPPPP